MRRRTASPPPDRLELLLREARPAGAPVARPGPRGSARDPVGVAAAEQHAGQTRPPAGVAARRRLKRRRSRPHHRTASRPAPPRVTLPGPFRQVRVRPAWGAVVGLALVGLAAALVMGVRAWTATASAVPTPVSPTGARSAAPAASGTAASSGAGTASRATATGGTATAAPTTLVVHVVGRVVSPGVVRLPGGSRVEDAVKAAGGASSGAELTSLNLARTLVDGEQIIVPAPGEAASAAPGPTSSGAARGTPSGGKPAGQPIDLNSADAAALDSLPGVGPVTAQKILDWRAAHGRFSSVDELAEVPGIGPKLLEQITPLVRV